MGAGYRQYFCIDIYDPAGCLVRGVDYVVGVVRMREILFRGKRKDSGEWVSGCYYKQSEFYGDEVDDHIIITSHEDLSFDQALEYCDVQAETVGQFITGLTDKNGTKIFEGDILTIAKRMDGMGEYYFPPIVYPGNVVVKWDMCAWMWETLGEDRLFISFPDAWCHFECEVIGNIHDNPELLESKQDQEEIDFDYAAEDDDGN